jgi:hypothetical protein
MADDDVQLVERAPRLRSTVQATYGRPKVFIPFCFTVFGTPGYSAAHVHRLSCRRGGEGSPTVMRFRKPTLLF